MIKVCPPTSVGFHLLLHSLRMPQHNRLHLTSCRARKTTICCMSFSSSSLLFFSFLYFVFHCFVLIPLCFIWLLKPERLAFGNKSLWVNILCALESKSVTPVCTSNCVPLQSPEPVLKLEPEELCQDRTLPGGFHRAGLHRFTLVPLFSVGERSCPKLWFLIISIANSMNTSSSCCQCTQDLKLTILDQCLRGAALNFNNTIKFLECEIYPDCRFCIFCTFSMRSYPPTEPEHSVPVSA